MLGDLTYGARRLLKERAFTAVVALTLALAMGASSTIYTMVHFSLLRDMPFADTETLTFLWSTNPELGRDQAPWSFPDFVDLREQTTAFEDLAAITETTVNVSRLEEPVRVRGLRATANFFPLMGLKPVLGRGFLPEEDRPDGPRVAVLSHGSWQRRFGGDTNILGREIVLDDEVHKVIGVMTPDLEVGFFMDVEIWVPLRLDVGRVPRDQRDLIVTARFRPGATLSQARAEMTTVTKRLREQYPLTHSGWSGVVVPYSEAIMGRNAKVIFLLLIMTVAFVMLIACANAANLLLARASARAKEIAVRMALGASRLRVVRQLLAESFVLSALGGALGLVFSHWAFALLLEVTRSQEPFFRDLRIDGNVLAFSLVIVLLTPLVFGLVPALRASRAQIAEELKEGGGRFASGWARQGFRRTLVTSEVSLALVLFIVSGLLVRSLFALTRIELGFDPEQVVTFRLDLSSVKYGKAHQIRAFFDEALAKVQSVPGIQKAGFVSHRPIIGGEPRRSFTIAGRPLPEPGKMPWAATITVTPEIFEVLRMPLLKGRHLSKRDTTEAPLVAVISQSATAHYWPQDRPLGARFRFADSEAWIEVVGIVADVRNPDADQPPEPHIYLPHAQNPLRSMALVARTRTDPLSVAATLHRAIWEIDPDQPIYDLRSMQQIVYDDLATSYALIGLMSYFTLVALGLAIAGVYSVISYSVSQRSREIGIRVALGAQAGEVLRMVLRQGLAPVALGAVIGIVGALVLSNVLTGLIYGITSTDPVTYLAVTLLLLVIALPAALRPAVRAARTDPIVVLRYE